jgi:HSP20 family protein
VARIYLERRGLRDVSRSLESLDAGLQGLLEALGGEPSAEAEYRPPIDVFETHDGVEIVADLPGVAAAAIRVVFSRGALVIAGRKGAPACHHRDAMFHLAERTFGWFACIVRLGVAVDARRARATLRAGELHVAFPRVDDRRGRDIVIAIESAS